jgi:hypothetical protein
MNGPNDERQTHVGVQRRRASQTGVLTHGHALITVYLTAEEIGLRQLDASQVGDELSELPYWGCMVALSGLHEMLEQAPPWPDQVLLRQIAKLGRWSLDEVFAALAWRRQPLSGAQRVLLTHHQITALQRLICLHCTDTDSSRFLTPDELARLVSVLYNAVAGAGDVDFGHRLRDWLVGVPMEIHQLLRYSLARAVDMYARVASSRQSKQSKYFCDFDAWMVERTGCSVEEYVQTGYLLRVLFAGRALSGGIVLDEPTLRGMGFGDSETAMLNSLSADPTAYREMFSSGLNVTPAARDTDAFLRYPIARQGDRWVLVSGDLLESRVSDVGLYWELFDEARKRRELDRFRQFNGEILERYLREIASYPAPGISRPSLPSGSEQVWVSGDFRYGSGGGSRAPDILISEPPALIVGETTSRLIRPASRIHVDADAIEDDLAGLIYTKIEQLGRRLADLTAGIVDVHGLEPDGYNDIWPLLILREHPPYVPGFARELRAFALANFPDDERIRPLTLLLVHQFEALVGVGSQYAEGMRGLLASRTSDLWIEADFSQWFTEVVGETRHVHRRMEQTFATIKQPLDAFLGAANDSSR